MASNKNYFESSDDEMDKSSDLSIDSDEQIAKADQQIAKADQQIAKADQQIAKADQQIAKTDEEFFHTDEQNSDDDDTEIEKFFIIENKGCKLCKKIKNEFYIFEDTEKKRYLVFCKVVNIEISKFRDIMEKESFSPWPISKHDHLSILNTMSFLNYNSIEYYIRSTLTNSIEKLRTIRYDKHIHKFLSSK